jgi:hypothetical protein
MDYGMLVSIDWNSNDWKALPTKQDLGHAKFGFVVENGFSHTCLNFGHEEYPVDSEGYYYGLIPKFWTHRPNPQKAQHVKIVFFRSRNWAMPANYIVGFYAFPQFFVTCERPTPLPVGFQNELKVNVKALKESIHLVENRINITAQPDLQNFLPGGMQLARQGFNYLTFENVHNILNAFIALNPDDQALKEIKKKLM